MIWDVVKGFFGALFVVAIMFAIAILGGWFSAPADKGLELGSMLFVGVCFLAILSVVRGDPQ